MVKTALITGGSKGIGRKTAEQLAKSGFTVILNYRSDPFRAKQFAEELSAAYCVRTAVIEGDVSVKEDCEKIARFVLKEFGGVDILIHNAGPYIHERKLMADYSWEEWNALLSGNLTAVFYLTKQLLPAMKKKGFGRIITFGFERVETAPGWFERSAFAAAKTGLASLTKTIALEAAASGITANMVCPGDIRGEWKEKEIKEAEHTLSDFVPVGRPGTGEDVARVIRFLISEESSFITGAVLPVTGGQDVLGKHLRR